MAERFTEVDVYLDSPTGQKEYKVTLRDGQVYRIDASFISWKALVYKQLKPGSRIWKRVHKKLVQDAFDALTNQTP